MRRYMAVSYPVEGLEKYTDHPHFTMESLLTTVLSVIQEATRPLDIGAKWFDVWDMIMSWMAMVDYVEDTTIDPIIAKDLRRNIRGTVLNHADLVTDLANYVVECAGLNFHGWKAVTNQYPPDTEFKVVDISSSGILIEVRNEQQAA